MFERWNNAPWTARGFKFKSIVETIIGIAVVILVLGFVGWLETH